MLKLMKKNKEYIIMYLVIFIFSIIMCHNFLKPHYSSDTWAIIDKGYINYAMDFFMGDARLFSVFSMFIADLCNINIDAFVVVMDFLAIIISCISVIILYSLFLNLLNLKDNNVYKFLILIGSYLIIFGHMSIEYYLFAESAIMCLSILFNVISIAILNSDKKHKNLKSALVLLLATFSYQGNLGIFVVINMLIIFIKEDKVKLILKKILKVFVIYALVCVINLIIMKLINNLILHQEQYRVVMDLNLLDKLYRAFNNISKGFIYSFDFIYPYTNIIVFILTIVIMICMRSKVKDYIKCIILMISGVGMCLYYDIFTTNVVYFQSRICTTIGILWGIYVLYLTCINYKSEKNSHSINVFIMIFAISLLLYTTYTYIKLSDNHIYSNSIYIETGNVIKKKVKEYEMRTGQTVKYVSFYNDKKIYAEDIVKSGYVYPLPKNVLNLGSLTENPLYKAYCYTEYLNYFLQREFEYKDIEYSVYLEKFKDCDWDTFDETQIFVDNETVYIGSY